MRKIYFLAAILMASLTNAQASWTFDNTTAASPANSGTFTLIGSTVAAGFQNVSGNTGYSFDKFPSDNGTGQNSPANTTGTSGIQFQTNGSTLSPVYFTLSIAGSNQSSGLCKVEYSTNGTTWTAFTNPSPIAGQATTTFSVPAVNTAYANYIFNCSSCSNQPNVYFRVTSVISQTTNNYISVQGGGYNGNNGYWVIGGAGISQTLSSINNEISGLKMFPNPAKTVLNITSDSFDAKTVEIYNVVGAKVMSTKATNSPINIAQLKTGVYMVKITEGQKTATRKLVVE
jgi:Secretion system C-terminal sorting domain